MLSTISMGMVFALPFIFGALVISAALIIAVILCGFADSLIILLSGGIIKLVNIKVKWRSFSVYSTVLLIIGAVVTAASITMTVFGVNIISGVGYTGPGLFVWLYYGIFSIGMVVFAPLGIIGALLEIIYQRKRKNILKGFSVSLITLASIAFAITVGIIIWLAAVSAGAI